MGLQSIMNTSDWECSSFSTNSLGLIVLQEKGMTEIGSWDFIVDFTGDAAMTTSENE